MQRDQPGDPAIREQSEAFTARLREDLIRNGDLSIVGEDLDRRPIDEDVQFHATVLCR